jgi:hypothetical protein
MDGQSLHAVSQLPQAYPKQLRGLCTLKTRLPQSPPEQRSLHHAQVGRQAQWQGRFGMIRTHYRRPKRVRQA